MNTRQIYKWIAKKDWLMRASGEEAFTLTELMLAMVLFSTVLVISTVGFIGMNRTFNRGVIKKQLSEAVQSVSEDVSRTLRAQPADREPVGCDGGEDCSLPGWNTLTFATACYLWPMDANTGGLYKRVGSCVDDNKKQEILDGRYKAREFSIHRVSVLEEGSLYGVSGVFTTMNDDAIHFPDQESGDLQWRCKGTAESPDVATCAVEVFNTIINPQGGAE